jgi:hypothetical protein
MHRLEPCPFQVIICDCSHAGRYLHSSFKISFIQPVPEDSLIPVPGSWVHRAACLPPAVSSNISVQVECPFNAIIYWSPNYCACSVFCLPKFLDIAQTSFLLLQAACSDVQNALVDPDRPSPCGVFTKEFFGPIAQGIHGRVVAGGSSMCGAVVRQWAQKSEWHVALPQAFCGWQVRDSLQVSAVSGVNVRMRFALLDSHVCIRASCQLALYSTGIISLHCPFSHMRPFSLPPLASPSLSTVLSDFFH